MNRHSSELLKNKSLFVLDMDGTFYLGEKLLDGSLDFVERIEEKGMDFVFFTNNSSKNSKSCAEKLIRLGCRAAKSRVITSGMVTIDYLKTVYGAPKVHLLGTPALIDDFMEAGLVLTDTAPDVVVAGFDTTIDYEKLVRACDFVRQGMPFIATHPDLNCPVETGFIPDCGAICAFITASTGVRPKILGKPYPETLEYLLRSLDVAKEEIVFVGDRLYTDIAIGANHGVTTVLVLSGETKIQDLKDAGAKPDIVVDKLADILDFLPNEKKDKA